MTNSAQPARRQKQIHQFKEMAQADPYRSPRKLAGRTLCSQCGAISMRGRWLPPSQIATSAAQPDHQSKCPACRQLEDRFAQGVIEIHGSRWLKHRDDVERTVRRTEKIARYRNDQERVLWISPPGAAIVKIYVTLPELARRIGRQLEKSFRGFAEYVRSTEEPYLRVRWWSDLLPVPRATLHRSAAFRGRGR